MSIKINQCNIIQIANGCKQREIVWIQGKNSKENNRY